ncbi:MAG TPA: zf-HC2 domain-containing protein [Gemmatimonadales bacterium]|jgi:anti-sigma factor RsiW|nr:zf-HC2 domain-containing protein [Gemmatimonadales bacterium]
MSHLDEGTLHALLDGELDLHEVKEIQAHIGSCAACGTRLREVKEFHGESDRLVGVLEVPSTPSRRTAIPPEFQAEPEPQPVDDRAVPRPPAPRPLPRTSGPAAEPPPLLLPENSEYGRAKFMRRMRWAALVLVTVGAGYLGTRARQSGTLQIDGIAFQAAPTDSGSGAVLSSEEAAAPAASPAADTSVPAETEAKARADAVPKRVAPRAEAPASPAGRQQSKPEAAGGPAGERGGLQEADDITLGAAAGDTDVAANEGAVEEPSADEAGEPAPPARQPDVRVEAARALRQLDRERQVDRADAATAALDSIRAREALLRQTAAPAAPAPRTPEQRAQIYLRIGLDEAAKQLGRPVHVIEGMSPLFMGLAFGRVSPGADATRPVVRVVYQDSQGRLIMLDQQRLRAGQSTSAPGNEPHWVVGEIALHLSGEVGADVLRNYRARVR